MKSLGWHEFTFAADFEAARVGVASFASCANFAVDLVKCDVTRHVKEDRREKRNSKSILYIFIFLKNLKNF